MAFPSTSVGCGVLCWAGARLELGSAQETRAQAQAQEQVAGRSPLDWCVKPGLLPVYWHLSSSSSSIAVCIRVVEVACTTRPPADIASARRVVGGHGA